jgi:hypothetical protein
MVENAEVRIVYKVWEEYLKGRSHLGHILRAYVDNIKLDSRENVAKA